MGSQCSQQPLHPQLQPICASEPRFCLPDNIKLRLKETSDDVLKITDAICVNRVYFYCDIGTFGEKVLMDPKTLPVLTMKGIYGKFKIFAGERSTRQTGRFKSESTPMTAKLSAVFRDALDGVKHHLVLKGDWISKNGTIYLGQPKQGGIPLAHTSRPLGLDLDDDEYIIEIAANVDIAICTMMCLALHEDSREW